MARESVPVSEVDHPLLRKRGTSSRADLFSSTANLSEKSVGADDDDEATRKEARIQELMADTPFLDTEHAIGTYEAIKLVLMAPVAILRVVLLVVTFGIASLGCWLICLGVDRSVGQGPRRAKATRVWVRGCAYLSQVLAGLYYVPIRGVENLREAERVRAAVVINHVSYLDALVVAAALAPCGVAKASVAGIPLIGAVARSLGFVFVARRGSSDVRDAYTLPPGADPVEAIRRAASDPTHGLLMIAPEGTTKSRPSLLRYKRGAFEAGVPVVPLLFRYAYVHHNPGWGLVRSTPWHVFRTLAQLWNAVELEFLPVQRARPGETPADFAARVRNLVADRLRLPLVDQGVTEERLLLRAGVFASNKGDSVVRRPLRGGKPAGAAAPGRDRPAERAGGPGPPASPEAGSSVAPEGSLARTFSELAEPIREALEEGVARIESQLEGARFLGDADLRDSAGDAPAALDGGSTLGPVAESGSAADGLPAGVNGDEPPELAPELRKDQ